MIVTSRQYVKQPKGEGGLNPLWSTGLCCVPHKCSIGPRSYLRPFRNVSLEACVELMSIEVCGIADGNQMRIKLCVVFLLI